MSLGANDEQLGACLDSANVRSELLALTHLLEPPSPLSVRLEDFTVPAKDASEDDVVKCLKRYGVYIIEKLAPEELLAELNTDLEEAGAWKTRSSTLGVEAFLKAPRYKHSWRMSYC